MPDDLIGRLPKCELHIHIEGSLEPELMFALARRNGIRLPYDSVEALRRAYQFTQLQDFLDIYYRGMSVLITAQDFFDLAFAYLTRAQADNVRHVEMFFDPQGHTARGVAFSTVIDGLHRAIERAQGELGISASLIMCFLRHLDEDDAHITLDAALAHRSKIMGVGLDSSELGHPPAKFTKVFRRAREAGLSLFAHAGEEGPASYVWEAIDVLGVNRVDHGNRSLEDAALVARLAPVNSDDPAYFGGYVNDNYRAVQQSLGLSRDEIVAIARNGFTASMMSEADRRQALAEFDRVVAGGA